MSSNPTASKVQAAAGSTTPAEQAMHRAAVEGHGNSPAAWALVMISLVGALVCSIAFILANTPLFIAGAVVMVIGCAVGFIMRRMGYGVGGDKVKASGPGH
ncbi:hypothetical protein ODZ83_02545 [Acaricomes phytoseiuli]|uniref:HGxxPAAW family protein n=1 Tax=Acaricomes phytoseiuli TaxID=291968 RepID=UPI00036E45CE|nr:HGxxPAAW family protein [Acaricomes phytoseiuli]MCW1249079.1 hypothetical protein [Acaricomes phytoseiuli]